MTNDTPTQASWAHADDAGKRALTEARSRTLWQAISAVAAIDPDRDALVAADDAGVVQRLSYGQLLTRIRHFSAGFSGSAMASC